MINWRTYAQGTQSNAKDQGTRVFETEGQFQTYWQQVNGSVAGRMPAGGVDWAKEKLIAINLGTRANPGYGVSVASIKRASAGTIQVTFQEQLPMRGVMYPQVISSPWVIVKMERAPGNIVFKGETVQRSTGIYIPPQNQNKGKCCGDVCKCCESCGCSCRPKRRDGG